MCAKNKVFKLCIMLIVCLICSNIGYSQTKYNLTGTIVDSQSTPIFQGNIIIYNSDSIFVTGSLIKGGVFNLPYISTKQIIVKIISLGYKTKFINISNTTGKDSISIGKIVLEINTLNTVEVTSYIPLFESKGTTSIINVDKTILSTSINPLEILKKLPGVRVKSGQITIIGKGSAAIYMDGQRITKQQFENIPVSQIIKIEIIRDPSARYDGNVAAIIKVITRNFHYEGTSVDIRTGVVLPLFFINSALGVNYHKNKWTLKANYNNVYGSKLNTSSRMTEKSNQFKTNLSVDENLNINSQTINVGVGNKIDSISSISFNYNLNYSKIKVDVFSKNTIQSNQISVFDVDILGKIKQLNHNYVANYNRQLDTLGSNLFIGSQYTQYSLGLSQFISEKLKVDSILIPNQDKRIESVNNINIISFRADYEKYFSKETNLGFGSKFSNSQTIGESNLFTTANPNLANNSFLTSNTLFGENIFAVYTTFNTTIKKIKISSGLRFEHTEAVGKSTQQNLNRYYNWILPSISIQKSLNKKVNFSLSYNTTIGRPSYNDLDPKYIYIDSLTTRQGNPLLLPQRDHSITAALNIGPMKIYGTYYHSFNAFKDVIKKGLSGDNSVTMFKENVQADRFYTSITLPFGTKFMQAYIYYIVAWDKILGDQASFSKIDLTPYQNLYVYGSFRMKKWFNIETIANYSSGRFDGIYNDLYELSLSIGVSKSFLDTKLKCSIYANDVFFTERYAGSFYYDDYSVDYLDRTASRFIRFSLNYKFGRLKHDKYKSINVGKEEGRRLK